MALARIVGGYVMDFDSDWSRDSDTDWGSLGAARVPPLCPSASYGYSHSYRR